jgi:hypothetical protein
VFEQRVSVEKMVKIQLVISQAEQKNGQLDTLKQMIQELRFLP